MHHCRQACTRAHEQAHAREPAAPSPGLHTRRNGRGCTAQPTSHAHARTRWSAAAQPSTACMRNGEPLIPLSGRPVTPHRRTRDTEAMFVCFAFTWGRTARHWAEQCGTGQSGEIEHTSWEGRGGGGEALARPDPGGDGTRAMSNGTIRYRHSNAGKLKFSVAKNRSISYSLPCTAMHSHAQRCLVGPVRRTPSGSTTARRILTSGSLRLAGGYRWRAGAHRGTFSTPRVLLVLFG